MAGDRPAAEPTEVLAAASERSARALQEASAGRALCRIDGSGGPTPFFVKRAEGDAAALSDVRRALRRAPGTGVGAEVAAAALDVLGRWRADLDRWRRAGSGPWIAYCEGGCDSVEALIADLENSSAGTSADPAADPAGAAAEDEPSAFS